jgi:hypothetical protein
MFFCRFYIGCDQCQDWYHGSCVGISEAEAASIESYVCERCQQQQVESPENAGGTLNQLVLEDHHYKHLKRLLRDLKVCPICCLIKKQAFAQLF